jgi:hypothetical protein
LTSTGSSGYPGRVAAKKKNNALANAASKRLGRIGQAPAKLSPEQMARMLMHAEERGEVERVPLEDGSWGWMMQGPDGKSQILKPTPEMLAALHKFETEGHPSHDDE